MSRVLLHPNYWLEGVGYIYINANESEDADNDEKTITQRWHQTR